MESAESYLKKKVEFINKDKESLDAIRSWIDGYEGKIVTLKGSSSSYHIIFTKEAVTFRKGIYPSSEIYYEASDEVILDVLEGRRNAYAEARSGRCKLRGSLNEATSFEKIFIMRNP